MATKRAQFALNFPSMASAVAALTHSMNEAFTVTRVHEYPGVLEDDGNAVVDKVFNAWNDPDESNENNVALFDVSYHCVSGEEIRAGHVFAYIDRSTDERRFVIVVN